jgi:hypothetical protein
MEMRGMTPSCFAREGNRAAVYGLADFGTILALSLSLSLTASAISRFSSPGAASRFGRQGKTVFGIWSRSCLAYEAGPFCRSVNGKGAAP